MDLDKVVQLIRGPKGTEVHLTISPADDRAARRTVTLVRDEIKLEDQEAKGKADRNTQRPRRHKPRRASLTCRRFTPTIACRAAGTISRSTHQLMSQNWSIKLKQEKVDGIILDLRSNPGGSLEEAIGSPASSSRTASGRIGARAGRHVARRCGPRIPPCFTRPARRMINRLARPPRRSPPPRCKITAAPSSSATLPRTARARCKT